MGFFICRCKRSKTLVNSVFVAALSQARGISKALNYT